MTTTLHVSEEMIELWPNPVVRAETHVSKEQRFVLSMLFALMAGKVAPNRFINCTFRTCDCMDRCREYVDV